MNLKTQTAYEERHVDRMPLKLEKSDLDYICKFLVIFLMFNSF